jgi:hypothetical protein
MDLDAICVRGNHDETSLAACVKRRQMQQQTNSQVQQEAATGTTSQEKGSQREIQELLRSEMAGFEWTDDLTDEQIHWLDGLVYTLLLPPIWTYPCEGTPRRVRIVHAGLVPGVPLEEQVLNTCLF